MEKEILTILKDIQNDIKTLKEEQNKIITSMLTNRFFEIENKRESTLDNIAAPKEITDIYRKIETKLTTTQFKTWMEPIVKQTIIDGEKVIVFCPSSFHYEIIKKKFLKLMKDCSGKIVLLKNPAEITNDKL